MTTVAKASFGASLSWNDVAMAEIHTIGGLKVSVAFKDVTSHGSPSSFREKIPTLLEAGAIAFKGNFIASDAVRQAMYTDCFAKTARTVIITSPDGDWTWTATCYVGELEIDPMPIDGEQAISGSLQPTGVSTLALTASAGLSNLTGIEENVGAALDFIPNFAIGTFIYTVAVNTASTYVKFTPTGASHTITILNGFDDSEATVATGNQSGELDLGAANTVTKFTITAQETGKVAKVYTVYVTRAAS